MKVYEYENCSTCKSALKFLDAKGVKYEKVCIVDHPPSETELKKMLGFIKAAGGTIKNLFNTSGVVYREQKIAAQLKAGMTESEALKLLSKNGKLIKRPFLLTKNSGTVGFKPEVWKELI
jgi:arsenate reductase